MGDLKGLNVVEKKFNELLRRNNIELIKYDLKKVLERVKKERIFK